MAVFNQNNIGRTVTIKGKQEIVSQVLASGEKFRIQSEINGPVVHDFGLEDVESAQVLTISFDKGSTWKDVPVISAKL